MTNRRKLLAGCCILLLAAVLILYQVISSRPKPVLSDPETAQLVYIRVDFPDQDESFFLWMPDTPEEEETAQDILDYLSQCQVKPGRSGTRYGGSSTWPFMTIMVQLSDRQSLGILLGPSETPEGPVQADFSYDASSSASSLWSHPAELLEPDALRSYVLQTLDLPKDFL